MDLELQDKVAHWRRSKGLGRRLCGAAAHEGVKCHLAVPGRPGAGGAGDS